VITELEVTVTVLSEPVSLGAGIEKVCMLTSGVDRPLPLLSEDEAGSRVLILVFDTPEASDPSMRQEQAPLTLAGSAVLRIGLRKSGVETSLRLIDMKDSRFNKPSRLRSSIYSSSSASSSKSSMSRFLRVLVGQLRS
jgi:hypothetical protein